jgi:hypothetical protein
MKEFVFEVSLEVQVLVRAEDEAAARKAVPTILGTAAIGQDAAVTLTDVSLHLLRLEGDPKLVGVEVGVEGEPPRKGPAHSHQLTLSPDPRCDSAEPLGDANSSEPDDDAAHPSPGSG